MRRRGEMAIPTCYGGVNFRSRLEARWAAFFDLICWSWDYEPIDLEGYIPDFILGFERKLLVEVKPELTFDDLIAGCTAKIAASGWRGRVLLCGAVGQIVRGAILDSGAWFESSRDLCNGRFWREAGNRVQWKPATTGTR